MGNKYSEESPDKQKGILNSISDKIFSKKSAVP